MEKTLCAFCRNPLGTTNLHEIADHPVYKAGELSYIELAHVGCLDKSDTPHKNLWRMRKNPCAICEKPIKVGQPHEDVRVYTRPIKFSHCAYAHTTCLDAMPFGGYADQAYSFTRGL